MTNSVGQDLPPFVVEAVDTEAMKQWAVFLADANPIHLDVEAVKAMGLGDRVINQGPINVAYMMNLLIKAFPGGRIEAMTTRFIDNVYGGERIVANGRIEAIDGNRITCAITLDSTDRGAVCSASATVILA